MARLRDSFQSLSKVTQRLARSGIDVGNRFFKPVKVLLVHDESVWSLLNQVIVHVNTALDAVSSFLLLVKVTQNFESLPQVSLLDLVSAFNVILVRQLVDNCLPLLEQFGCS